MRLAAIPVQASKITFGFDGSSPALLRIFSAHFLTILIKKVFPTPPPPKSTTKSILKVQKLLFKAYHELEVLEDST